MFGETQTFIVDMPELPDAGDISIQLLDVEAVQETFYAGPYAKYAEKYLGIKARQKDETLFQITEVTMSSALIVKSTELAVLLNSNDSVDAFIDAGNCLTVIFCDALLVPE